MKILNFFIDELGSANPGDTKSKYYILSGIMLDAHARENIRICADQIKFKYWGSTSIVFHSREIGRQEGDFAIFKDEVVYKDFVKDLIKLLNTGNFQLFGVLVDKAKVPKNWNAKTIYKKTANAIIRNYIFALLAQKNCRGRLTIESATAEKDFYYHKIAGHYLSNGFAPLKINYREVQEVLTEISLVT